MKHFAAGLLPFLVILGVAAEEALVPQPGPRLLVCGWHLGYLAVYDGQGREEWRIGKTGEQIDAWLLDDGNVLYTAVGSVRAAMSLGRPCA